MAWHIDICDDEQEICDLLKNFVTRYQADAGEKFEIRIFHSAEELLGSKQAETDIILLDIKMEGMTGMDAARELRARGSKVSIVFITTMTQYAMEGYEVHAFGFLKKPPMYPVFRRLMNDLLSHLHREQDDQWEVKFGSSSTMVAAKGILCLDALGHSVTVRMADGSSLPCGTTLSEAENQLSNMGFYRCHKSFLVNLTRIKQIDTDTITLSDGTQIPLSRHRRKEFLAAFAHHREGML